MYSCCLRFSQSGRLPSESTVNLENFSFNTIRTVDEALTRRANIINCIDDSARVELGKSTPYAGEASLKALEAAVKDLAEGKIDVIVTGPINKSNIKSEKVQFQRTYRVF